MSFVDCRWELGNPGRGREPYLAGHIPGASFLDVDEDDLSARPCVRRSPPAAERRSAARAASRCRDRGRRPRRRLREHGRRRASRWLLRHFGTTTAPVLDLDGWLGPLRSGEEQIEPAAFQPNERHDDTVTRRGAERSPRRARRRRPAFESASAASRTRSTACPAGFRRDQRPGTSRCPSPAGSSSPTAAPASPPASSCAAPRSQGAMRSSCEPGANGSSSGCPSREAEGHADRRLAPPPSPARLESG